MQYESSLAYAQAQDEQDPLRNYRQQFHFPQHEGKDCIYFCGNSLGLQPKAAKAALLQELERWQQLGVEGHFRGNMPWTQYHKFLAPQSAHVVGAHEDEVVVMNTLTVNLHLLMVSFYRPTAKRYKIIMEGGAFPSDQYAVASQAQFHGFDPEAAIVEVFPREGELTLRTSDITEAIAEHGDSVALVLFSGIQYFTGQCFDMKRITEAGHRAGAVVGFDLAHAAGNVLLSLHDWQVDFAVWCNYKYLNSGPGGPSGVFVHRRHGDNAALPRFAGWWGHDEARRFLMEKEFVPMKGAEGWQVSNNFILSFATTKTGLDLFHEAGMDKLRTKSIRLTGYLEFLISELQQDGIQFKIITPTEPSERGCQLSFHIAQNGKALFNYLANHGVICDWREDNLTGEGGVIRIAPTPMYNSFEDVFRFVELIKNFT
ncbi:MAG: kynureninase [Bacteroidota bacterium]